MRMRQIVFGIFVLNLFGCSEAPSVTDARAEEALVDGASGIDGSVTNPDGSVTDGNTNTDAGLPTADGAAPVVCGPAATAYYPLQIIQPMAGGGLENRFYKAYPGLLYRAWVAAIGGAYPLSHTLDLAPAGMTIEAHSGELRWPSPTLSGSPHAVRVRVTDCLGNTQSVDWAITVTEEGFIFLDAENGKTRAMGGDGSLTNAFRSVADWYAKNVDPTTYDAKYDVSYPGAFVYYKSGVYDPADAYLEDDGTRLALLADRKPMVHMAFPGEKPIIDYSTAYIELYSGNNLYWEGFEHRNLVNPGRFALRIGAGDDMTIVNNVFHGMSYKPGSHNQAAIMFTAVMPSVRARIAITDNEFYDLDHGYCTIVYHTEEVLFARNRAHDIRPTDELHHCVGLKVSAPRWFIRDNQFTKISGASQSIWLYLADEHNGFSYQNEEIEVSFNKVVHSEDEVGEATMLAHYEDYAFGPIWIFRNTFVRGAFTLRNVNRASDGPMEIHHNVIVNDYDEPQHITLSNCSHPERVDIHDNLVGTLADGIVDADGELTAAYESYRGTHGWR